MTRSCPPLFAAAALFLAGCSHGGGAQNLSSTTTPGNPIISYPDTEDRTVSTSFLSNPNAQVSGIAGQALTITVWHGTQPSDLFALDANGNVGLAGSLAIRGNISTVSTRTQKKDIAPFDEDPLQLLRQVRIVTYRYKNENESAAPHIGFIAEDTPSELSGPEHNEFSINNSLAVSIAAQQTLDLKVEQLQKQVEELQAEIKALRQSQH